MLSLISFCIQCCFALALMALGFLALHGLYYALCWLLDKLPDTEEKEDYKEPPSPYDGL